MKEKRLLYKLKTNAITLRKNKQIPSLLYDCIMRLTLNDNLDYVNFLADLSKEYMRIKGYYSSVQKENKVNNEISKELKKFR